MEDNKKNAQGFNTSGLLFSGIAMTILVCGIIVAAIGMLIAGILEGTPPTSDHNKKLPVNKNESVAVTADSYGNATKVTDTVYITNNPEHKVLRDESILKNVTNSKQKSNLPERVEDEVLKWSAKGYDVSYSGDAEPSDLPITISVRYFLNNKEVDPDDLVGKSGVLKVVINYHNNIKATLDNGNEIVVPYAATTLLLSTSDLSKIKCSTGSSISIGGNEIAMGVNIPGMSELSGSDLFGVGTSETIFYGKISDFKGAQIKTIINGDIVANIDGAKLSALNPDALVIKVSSAANKAMTMIDKYYPYIDIVNGYVPKVMDVSSKARTTTNKVMNKIIDFLKRMDDSYNTVEGTSNLYESLMDQFYKQIFGKSSDDGDTDTTLGKSVDEAVNEMGKAITGYDKKKDDSEETEHVNGVVDELGETLPLLEQAEEAAGPETEEGKKCEDQIKDICNSIFELDPDSEYLEKYDGDADGDKDYLTEEQKARRIDNETGGDDAKDGLIDEYNASISILELYEKIYNNPDFVKTYFEDTKASLEENKKSLQDKIAAESDETKKTELEEKLADVEKDLSQLVTFEKKAKKDDGTYYSLKELEKMGGTAKDIVAYIIDQLISTEQKEAIIAKLEKANSFVNKTDNLIQKYGKKAPALVKQLKNLKSKIDKLYYKKFLKYMGIYEKSLSGTTDALAKTIEAHKKVANFSGLTDGWTGTTSYTFTIKFGTERNVKELLATMVSNKQKNKNQSTATAGSNKTKTKTKTKTTGSKNEN